MRSPVNQVFQFTQSGECSAWTDKSKTSATAYLWIPENCRKVRGLVILCSNVPEHMLAGHPALRESCAANGLGIVFFPRSFYNFKAKNENKTHVAFLQQVLDGLAKQSGYDEIATAPWLPMGESGHLLMVDALVETAPERCIAGIWIKNNHLPPKNRTTPAFVLFGTAQEWSQDKPDKSNTDIRSRWNSGMDGYALVLNERKSHPDWPLSYVIDGSSGHFDCSERLARLIARYVDQVCKARLPEDGSAHLKPVDLANGFVADLPVPGHENHPVTACRETSADARALPWYFDKESAGEAQAIARINWKAETQLPAITDTKGHLFPFSFNGITWITLNGKPAPLPDGTTPPMLESEPDGITFQLKGILLDKIPANFVSAGGQLAKAPGTPSIEWMCGCVEPLGNNRMRIALDRTWPSPIYIAVRQAGTDSIRGIVQPCQINRDANSEGKSQTIAFEKLSNVRAGTASIPLRAFSDAGLPVSFYVEVGPAIVKDGNLIFTKIPPRSRFPITVTVAAWQFGRYAEPKVKRAQIIKQTFQILAPSIMKEADIPPYTLPDPLVCQDGTRVTDAATWNTKRRPELLKLFEQHVYGKMLLGRLDAMHFVVREEKKDARGGKATRLRVGVLFDGKEKGPQMELLIYLPNQVKGRVPLIYGPNFDGNFATSDEPDIPLPKHHMQGLFENKTVDHIPVERSRGTDKVRWQYDLALEHGFGVATVAYGEIEPDIDGRWKQGPRSLAPAPGLGDWGCLGVWAWALSRGMDYFETNPRIDSKRVAIMGFSRLGKTILWAAAQDQRFALAISHNSGAGGAALSRRIFGETVYDLTTRFPHWFCGKYADYGNREDQCPVDQHELLALCAPRPVLINSATEDLWSDPKGEFLSAVAAAPVFRLLGGEGISQTEWPEPGKLLNSQIGYFLRPGRHDVTREDWNAIIAFAEKHLR